jgi:DNA-binding MarR family transcriptional regulator
MQRTNTPADPSLLLENQLCFALYSASLAMTKAYKLLLDDLGLTYPQFLVMIVLWERDGITVSEIGKRLFLESGTLTPLLKRLERGGFIVRLRDARDERQVRIRLTAPGRQLNERALVVCESVFETTRCPRSELFTLSRQLTALRVRLLS